MCSIPFGFPKQYTFPKQSVVSHVLKKVAGPFTGKLPGSKHRVPCFVAATLVGVVHGRTAASLLRLRRQSSRESPAAHWILALHAHPAGSSPHMSVPEAACRAVCCVRSRSCPVRWRRSAGLHAATATEKPSTAARLGLS